MASKTQKLKKTVKKTLTEKNKKSTATREFKLVGVDTNKLDQIYGLVDIANSSIPEEATKISDLKSKDSSGFLQLEKEISFLDDAKRTKIVESFGVGNSKAIHCYWDHHPIKKFYISCPLEYIFPKIERKYYSEITKKTYDIREELTAKNCDRFVSEPCHLQSNSEIKLLASGKGYYIMEGTFCSFNCCLSYIKSNSHDCVYQNAEQLLYKMYTEIFGKKIAKIIPANHWRTLSVYGGKLSIEKFRENLDLIEFDFQGTIGSRPLYHLFEERLKF